MAPQQSRECSADTLAHKSVYPAQRKEKRSTRVSISGFGRGNRTAADIHGRRPSAVSSRSMLPPIATRHAFRNSYRANNHERVSLFAVYVWLSRAGRDKPNTTGKRGVVCTRLMQLPLGSPVLCIVIKACRTVPMRQQRKKRQVKRRTSLIERTTDCVCVNAKRPVPHRVYIAPNALATASRNASKKRIYQKIKMAKLLDAPLTPAFRRRRPRFRPWSRELPVPP